LTESRTVENNHEDTIAPPPARTNRQAGSLPNKPMVYWGFNVTDSPKSAAKTPAQNAPKA